MKSTQPRMKAETIASRLMEIWKTVDAFADLDLFATICNKQKYSKNLADELTIKAAKRERKLMGMLAHRLWKKFGGQNDWEHQIILWYRENLKFEPVNPSMNFEDYYDDRLEDLFDQIEAIREHEHEQD